ncbi:nitrate- and nitrite sensing domain-containing protein [Streptomyces sp. NPDC003023]|uniref:sensor histidine kinase n=1 Tax=Streptomyces sp. NPDC003023 TaxID=3364675 RepID=UPI0036B7978E
MRIRNKPIRVQITALLLVPLTSLVGLGVFTALTVTVEAREMVLGTRLRQQFGRSADGFLLALQNERSAAMASLASGGSGAVVQQVQTAATDELADAVVRSQAHQGASLTSECQTKLSELVALIEQLPAVREQVRVKVPAHQVMESYNTLVTATIQFRFSLTADTFATHSHRVSVLDDLTLIREFISQEEAALAASQENKPLSEPLFRLLDGSVEVHRTLYHLTAPELRGQDRAAYARVEQSGSWKDLDRFEASFLRDDHEETRLVVRPALWRSSAQTVLRDMALIESGINQDIAEESREQAFAVIREQAVIGGLALVAVLTSVALSVRTGRSLVRQLLTLRDTAQDLAHSRLPRTIGQLRRGEPVDGEAAAAPLAVHSNEIGQVCRAFNVVQRAAIDAAMEQSALRRSRDAVFVNLARRTQSLVHQQHAALDMMQRQAADPDELTNLFRLDHLTTRMRRHADGLIVLSGGSSTIGRHEAVSVLDLVRGAAGEVEDYTRISLCPSPMVDIIGPAVADMTHLIAELLENATRFSAPDTSVTVSGDLVSQGYVLDIVDRGLGMGAEAMARANRNLTSEDEFEHADAERLGLFVVNRLARRHGADVALRHSAYGGTSAVILLPHSLLIFDGDHSDLERPPGPTVPTASPSQTAVPSRGDLRQSRDGRAEQDTELGSYPAQESHPDSAHGADPINTHRPQPRSGARADLPRRVPQANPSRRQSVGSGHGARDPGLENHRVPSPREDSPERARDTFTAFHRGTPLETPGSTPNTPHTHTTDEGDTL